MCSKIKENGFSIIEIVIVMTIIGLLATFGVPSYWKMKMKAQQSEMKVLLGTMYMAQKTFYGEWNQYYADFNAVGFQVDGDLTYNAGFASGGVTGPAAHPGPQYKSRPPVIKDINAFCKSVGTCNIDKAKTTKLVSGTTATATRYLFGAASNLDDDATLDEWTMDHEKQFSQVSDDLN